MNRLLCAALLALSMPGMTPASQESSDPKPKEQPKKKPANDIFSGSITELTGDALTVVRKVPARDAVTRKFTLDAQTKVEGSMRVKSRVTVRYQTNEDGQLHALHIIVR